MNSKHYKMLLKAVQNRSPQQWKEFRKAQGPGFVPRLRGADLRGWDLSGMDLSGADLERADLRGAVLEGTDLRGARLVGAKVDGPQVEKALLDHNLALRLRPVAARHEATPATSELDAFRRASSVFVILDDEE